MTLTAAIVFGVSLLLLLVLFLVKRIEANREHRFAEGIRARADAGALRIKQVLVRSESYLEELPFFLGAVSRYLVHIGALSFAKLARASAKRAHQLADLVSHKHGFQRRETKSSFLREVSEVKNGKVGEENGVENL